MDFLSKIFHNKRMGLQDYLALVRDVLEIKTIEQVSENSYILRSSERTFRLYQQGKQIILEGSIGNPVKDTPETNAMLSELLQFNLKRTQFLDNIVFLDNDTRQLFLRDVLSDKSVSSEQFSTHLEDFALNIEVIEDRFFPKLK